MADNVEKQQQEMTSKEIIDLFKESASKGNYIEIDGVIVHSTTESLKVVEKTANRLLTKWEEFLTLKKKSKILSGQGY